MDSSTERQCRKLENAVGGPLKLAEITGSRGYQRFTGAQIAKIAENQPESFAECERISLVSSFVSSMLVGDFAPIDFADGSGMNLMDIRTKKWNQSLLNAVAPDLAAKLGDPVPTLTTIGRISSYFVQRYGFDPNCLISAFTGDNPGKSL